MIDLQEDDEAFLFVRMRYPLAFERIEVWKIEVPEIYRLVLVEVIPTFSGLVERSMLSYEGKLYSLIMITRLNIESMPYETCSIDDFMKDDNDTFPYFYNWADDEFSYIIGPKDIDFYGQNTIERNRGTWFLTAVKSND